ncbi:beta,beta-carotene 15,15'-dioxygenase isoform X3 [Perognathus longimembris pacificus]|uniref:beta,beta-carotene 15,15'-dioxygenase isoform X3 n=1 Tax=Perognathus longimembris pacificus TaxID=214514 RepID=UPI002018747A|nr:beta,beta-carotene 15,15'-dioxygenase isoform X3 [Perognathus longimembris pacificus]
MDVIFGKNKKEQLEPVTAQVTGKIPTWLRGTLLRNGPGMHAVGESKYNHWFDGLALLHSFSIRDGEVYYRSKYLRSDTYNANIEANRIVVSEFGTMAYPDPCKNIFAKAFSYLSHTIPDFTDNCLINIMKCGKDFYATTETNYIRKINPHTLETLEKVDYRKYVAINLATAHPHYDGAGNVLNMGTSIVDKGKTKYVIFKIPASVPEEDQRRGKSPLKHTEVFCSIPSRSLLSPSYYHSFGLTDNHVVFLEQPFKLDILKMATAYMRGVSWASCMTFHKEDKTYIHIIDRRTRRPVPTKFYTDAMVVFHHVNAYEEDGCLLFDVIAYQDSSLYQLFYLANLNQDFEENSRLTSVPTLRRFALPLHVDKNAEVGSNLIRAASTRATATKEKDDCVYCQPELLYEGLELPQINYAHNGKPYRYIYAAGVQWSPIPTKILKYDLLTKSSLKWGEESCWPAEPLFVPAPGAKDEDDGVILSAIVSTDPQKPPFLLILDAKSFTELARASVAVEMHLDLHGLFVPDTDWDARNQSPSEAQQDTAADRQAAPRA